MTVCNLPQGRCELVYLMVLVLNETEHLEEILGKFYEIGINGATIIESTGMGRAICEDVPLFGGLRNLFNKCRPGNKTIFSVIKNEESIQKAIEVVESIIGDLDAAGKGILFTFPLHQVKGFVSQ